MIHIHLDDQFIFTDDIIQRVKDMEAIRDAENWHERGFTAKGKGELLSILKFITGQTGQSVINRMIELDKGETKGYRDKWYHGAFVACLWITQLKPELTAEYLFRTLKNRDAYRYLLSQAYTEHNY